MKYGELATCFPLTLIGSYQGLLHIPNSKCIPKTCWRAISSIYRSSSSVFCKHVKTFWPQVPAFRSSWTKLSTPKLQFAREPQSPLLKMEILGPHFQGFFFSLGKSQEPPEHLYNDAEFISALLTFDYSFDYIKLVMWAGYICFQD